MNPKYWFRKSNEILQNEGVLPLLTRSTNHIRRGLKGGISSRPHIQPIAGLFRPIYNTMFYLKYGSGTNIVAEDWDNLILLDACRYDDFKRENTIEGDLQSRISKGSKSVEFLRKNFAGRKLHDCVYVTANPHVSKLDDDIFHAIVDTPLTKWDSDYSCILPESVTNSAIKANKRYPNKRLIVHYMQPHDPPIGETIKENTDQTIEFGGPAPSDYNSGGVRMMVAVARGQIDVETAREAYRENIQIVLKDVHRLLDEIDGKTIVSSDHGEMFGEKPFPLLGRLYEHNHPHNLTLCKVPWLIVKNDYSHREITSDPPNRTRQTPDDEIEKQLKSLGYK